MLPFNIVKRIGEGHYLDEDFFILERVRRAKALNPQYKKEGTAKHKNRVFGRHGKSPLA